MRVLAVIPVAALALTACPPPDDEPPPPPPPDVVSIGGVTAFNNADARSLTASFTEVTGGDECVVSEVAGCVITDCSNAAAPVEFRQLDAGGINYVNEDEEVDLALAFGAEGYSVEAPAEPLFVGQEDLTVTAAGGADVDGFTMTLVAPRVLQLIQPPLSSVNVDRIDGIASQWEELGGAVGEVEMVYVDRPFTKQAICRFPVTALEGFMPPQVIGGFSSAEGELNVHVVNETSTQVDEDSSVFFRAFTHARSAVGQIARYNVFFTG